LDFQQSLLEPRLEVSTIVEPKREATVGINSETPNNTCLSFVDSLPFGEDFSVVPFKVTIQHFPSWKASKEIAKWANPIMDFSLKHDAIDVVIFDQEGHFLIIPINRDK